MHLSGSRFDEKKWQVGFGLESDIEGPELPWTIGQRRATFIYRHVLEPTPR